MTDNGYTKEEILKGERIVLQTLDFRVSSYCSPYSWVRKISKADDYDMQTRTLSKFIMEVTLLDHRFLRVKPSMIAAVGMYTSRVMLGGAWVCAGPLLMNTADGSFQDDAFVFYSGYVEDQLRVAHSYILEKLISPGFDAQYVYRKYAHKKFLKAAVFACQWAQQHCVEEST